MYQGIVALFLAAAGALAAAVPGGAGQQKPLGRLTQTSDVTRQYLSCEETYGSEWETCGDRNSRSCYSPALKHSCCGVDNSYCDEGAWCAPVAGYCCSDSEDLEACARNAGFELPDNETLGNLATIVVQASTSTGPPRISAATASSLRRRNADSASAGGSSNLTTPVAQHARVLTTWRKEQRTLSWWTLSWIGMGFGAATLLMMFR